MLGVACFVATVLLLGWLLGGGDEGTDEAAPPTSTPITFAPREQTTTTAAPTTTTTAPTTTTTAPTTTTTAAPTTTAASAPSTGSVPTLSSSFGGGWVALLTSVPQSAGQARLEAAWHEVRGVAPEARVARSEDWATLTDGFWVLVHPGPFGSSTEVRGFCDRIETSRTDCAPRELRRG